MITHSLSATTPDVTSYEIRPSHWNQAHVEARTLSGNTLGASTISGTNLVLQAGNNFTISANGDTVVFVGPNPAAGAFSAGVSTGGNSAGNTGVSGSQLVLVGSNNVTLSQATGANGATVTIQGASTSVQTNQTLGLYASSNTTGQSSSTTVDARTLSIRGAGAASVGYSAGELVISAPVQTAETGLSGLQVSDNTFTSGTVILRNANGISFGSSGANGVSASYTVPTVPAQFSAGVSGGNTSGDTGSVTARLFLAGGNNITLSGSTNAGSMTVTISGANAGGAQTGISGVQVSDTTFSSGTVIFRNANGLSFGSSGANGVSASYTVPTVPAQFSAGISGGNTSGDTGSVTARVFLAGGNNITLSGSTNAGSMSITISGANAGGAQTGISGIQVSDTTYSSGTVNFKNANGISFGSSGANGVSASYTVPTQTNQSLGIYNSSQTTGQSSSSTYDARSLSVVYSGNISGGWTNGSMLLNVTTAAQTNQTVGLYASSNTTGQSSSSTVDARSISIVGRGIASVGLSGGSFLVSVPAAVADGVNVIAAGTRTATTAGTVLFSNSNGISFNLDTVNGSVVTASYTVPTVTNSSWTASDTATSMTIARLALTGSNGITMGLSTAAGGSATITASYTVPSAQTAISGIQVSDTTYTSGTVTFRNANGISFGSSGANGISASYTVPVVPAQISVGNSNLGNTAGDTGVFTGRLVLVGTNNITLSGSSNGGSVTISISGAGAGAGQFSAGASNLGDTAGNTGVTGTRLVFVGSNGISLSQTTGTAGATLSFIGASNLSAGVTNAGNTSGNTGFVTGQFNLQGGNNITLSGSTNGGSMSVTISGANQSNQTLGLSATGNTTQGSTTTLNATSILLAGRGDISVGYSNGTLQISGTQTNQQISAFAASNTTQSTSGTFNASSVVFAGAGIASVGITNGSVVISVPSGGGAGGISAGVSTAGNTAGSTGTVSTGNFVLVGSGVISLSQSTGAAGSAATVSILAPATSSLVGQSGISLSSAGSTITIAPVTQSYLAYPILMVNSQTITVGSNTSYIAPIEFRDVEQFDFMRNIQSVSMASMASIATAANNTKSYTQQATTNFVLYSRGIGASSQSLQSVASTSASSGMNITIAQNANGSQWTVTHAFSWPASNGTTSSSASYATTLSNVNVSTTHLTAISGMKIGAFPWSSTFSAQQYWLMSGLNTAQTTNGNASLSNMRVTLSNWGASQINTTWAEFGSGVNASIQILYGIGSYTKAGVGTTASLGFSDVSSSASHIYPYVTFARIA